MNFIKLYCPKIFPHNSFYSVMRKKLSGFDQKKRIIFKKRPNTDLNNKSTSNTISNIDTTSPLLINPSSSSSDVSNDIVLETDTSIIYSSQPKMDSIHHDNTDYGKSRENEELIFTIAGQENQIAIIDIYPGKVVRSESAKLLYMTDGINMQTSAAGGLSGTFSRFLTGASFFMTEYSYSYDKGYGRIGFGESFPSKILPIRLSDYGGRIICQKGAFICGTPDVQIETHTLGLSTGLLGGEGIFLQKLTGNGTCLIKAGGSLIKRTLRAKEKLKLTPGLIICYEESVTYEKELVTGGSGFNRIKNMIGAGSILFATLTGPGDIYIQTMHFDNLVEEISARIPSRSSSKGGSGSYSSSNSSKGDSDISKGDSTNAEATAAATGAATADSISNSNIDSKEETYFNTPKQEENLSNEESYSNIPGQNKEETVSSSGGFFSSLFGNNKSDSE